MMPGRYWYYIRGRGSRCLIRGVATCRLQAYVVINIRCRCDRGGRFDQRMLQKTLVTKTYVTQKLLTTLRKKWRGLYWQWTISCRVACKVAVTPHFKVWQMNMTAFLLFHACGQNFLSHIPFVCSPKMSRSRNKSNCWITMRFLLRIHYLWKLPFSCFCF